MKIHSFNIVAIAAVLFTLPALAGPSKDFKDFKQAPEEDLFKDQEVQVDVFASFGAGENERKVKTVTKFHTDVRQVEVLPPTVPPIETERRTAASKVVSQSTFVSNGVVFQRTTTRTTDKVTTGHTGLLDQDSAFGGGVAANYFFARYFGAGLEADWLAGGEAIHLLDGNLFVRYPINVNMFGGRRGIAPYIFGGYGAKFDGVKWGIAHAGAGFEFRFSRSLACFIDGRYIFGHSDADTGLARTGLRVIF